MKNLTIKSGLSILVGLQIFVGVWSVARAATTLDPSYSDPTRSTFRIVVCDGPKLPPALKAEQEKALKRTYVPCDFNGIMLQIQHLINIMMILGVFASIGAFTWAGALYISGNPKKKEDAHKIFPKVFTGFIIMLSAWFIVYQVLSWLTDNAAFKTLLGNP